LVLVLGMSTECVNLLTMIFGMPGMAVKLGFGVALT